MKWTESEENLNRFFDHANNEKEGLQQFEH